jgi:hypothetical protein
MPLRVRVKQVLKMGTIAKGHHNEIQLRQKNSPAADFKTTALFGIYFTMSFINCIEWNSTPASPRLTYLRGCKAIFLLI